ncbi:MAG: gluconolactonase [Rhodospirillaceae bacterium]|nr:gluconolactonase [Rhodospirillaceae bacterium]|tara:strand:+ start:270 stop:1184 length:915 start_codon:yes stop_codon:yes gene_type:complete
MFAPPPAIEAEVFTRLPEPLRKTGHYSEWREGQPGAQPEHSLLEGPSFDLEGNLYCVDVAFGRVFRISPQGDWTLIAEYDGWPNGLKIHKDGRIFIADYKNGVMLLDPDSGSVTPVAVRYNLERFKAINDLVFASNGDIYFTDQGLTGLHDSTGRVFRLRVDGTVDRLLDNVPSPNGIVLSLDEETAFVAVTRDNSVWRMPMTPNGGVAKVGRFIQLSGGGGPDGLAIDSAGNLVICHVMMGSVWIMSPIGEPLLRIKSPEGLMTTNCAYGGPDNRTLYITESATGTILRAQVEVPGRPMFSHM